MERPGCLGKGHLCKVARGARGARGAHSGPACLSLARFHRHCRTRTYDLVIEPWQISIFQRVRERSELRVEDGKLIEVDAVCDSVRQVTGLCILYECWRSDGGS